MSEVPKPRPMPTTGMPDRVDTRSVPSDYSDMKKGMSSTGNGDPTRKSK